MMTLRYDARETLTLRLSRKVHEAEGIVRLELRAPDGADLPPFTAGAHIELDLPGGIRRPYSLCNSPFDRARYELGVRLEPESRGGSRAVHEVLEVGDLVRVSAPRNHFPLGEAPHVVLAAGGIGVTPLLAMAEALAAAGRSFELWYCARARRNAGFLARLSAAPWADRVRTFFDDEGARLDPGARLAAAPSGTALYTCGPEGFMGWVTAAARAAGLPEDAIHLERFSADPNAGGGDDFEVEVAGSGRAVAVGPAQTMAEALLAAGFDVPLSCEQGICGSCAVRVLEGEPDHRDHFFTDDEHAANDRMTPCCSRARSRRLVVEL